MRLSTIRLLIFWPQVRFLPRALRETGVFAVNSGYGLRIFSEEGSHRRRPHHNGRRGSGACFLGFRLPRAWHRRHRGDHGAQCDVHPPCSELIMGWGLRAGSPVWERSVCAAGEGRNVRWLRAQKVIELCGGCTFLFRHNLRQTHRRRAVSG